MLSKFYSVLIGIVIALTMVGLVVAGVTRVRMGRQAVAPEAVSDVTGGSVASNTPPAAEAPVAIAPEAAKPQDADTGIAIKGSVGTDIKVEAPKVHEVVLTEANFKFSPAQVTVKKGEQVHMTMKISEGVHNLFLSGYDIRTDVKKIGETATLNFTADKAGTFDYWCEVGSHKALGMTGKLIVE